MAKIGDADLQLPTMHYLPPVKQSMSNQTECCSSSLAARLLQNLPEKMHSADWWKPTYDDHLLEAEWTLWWHWDLCPTITLRYHFEAAIASIRCSRCWRTVISTEVLIASRRIWQVCSQVDRKTQAHEHHGIQANAKQRRHIKAATTDQVPGVLLREAGSLGDKVLYIYTCSTFSLLASWSRFEGLKSGARQERTCAHHMRWLCQLNQVMEQHSVQRMSRTWYAQHVVNWKQKIEKDMAFSHNEHKLSGQGVSLMISRSTITECAKMTYQSWIESHSARLVQLLVPGWTMRQQGLVLEQLRVPSAHVGGYSSALHAAGNGCMMCYNMPYTLAYWYTVLQSLKQMSHIHM